MSNKLVKPLSIAIGAAFIGSFALSAQASSFQVTDLDSGYMQVGEHGEKDKEGKCGEGKCGGDKKDKEGKCGEGKCGGDKKDKEGSCGGTV